MQELRFGIERVILLCIVVLSVLLFTGSCGPSRRDYHEFLSIDPGVGEFVYKHKA